MFTKFPLIFTNFPKIVTDCPEIVTDFPKICLKNIYEIFEQFLDLWHTPLASTMMLRHTGLRMSEAKSYIFSPALV